MNNNLDLSQYRYKKPNDPITADTWNGVFGDIQTAINALENNSSTPQGIDTEGVVSVNSKGNTTISASKHINLEPAYDENGSSSGTYGDVQIKPGDDITLESHHRQESKRDEITVKTSNGLSGNDKAPVKLQIIADDMTLSTKGKKGDDSNVMNVNVTTGEDKGYLKVRAQAIDLRSETHGGIALQPKGEDGSGHQNKIKFEHGGGDGLEFGTFNAEKTSIFTDEYRFNKDGVWKMATRNKIARANDDSKRDADDSTTHYYYQKLLDDFYDNISNADATATTQLIINTAHAFNDSTQGINTVSNSGTVTIHKDGVVYKSMPIPNTVLNSSFEDILSDYANYVFSAGSTTFTPPSRYSINNSFTLELLEADIKSQLGTSAEVELEISELFHNIESYDWSLPYYIVFTNDRTNGELLRILKIDGSSVTIGDNIQLNSSKIYINDIDADELELKSNLTSLKNKETDIVTLADNKNNIMAIVNHRGDLLKLANGSTSSTNNNFNFNTDSKFTAVEYVEGVTNPEVYVDSFTETINIVGNSTTVNTTCYKIDINNYFGNSMYINTGSGDWTLSNSSTHAIACNLDEIFDGCTPENSAFDINLTLNQYATASDNPTYAMIATAFWDLQKLRYGLNPSIMYTDLLQQQGQQNTATFRLPDYFLYNYNNYMKHPGDNDYDSNRPNILLVLKVLINAPGHASILSDTQLSSSDTGGVFDTNDTINLFKWTRGTYYTSDMTYTGNATTGTDYTADLILSMFTWNGLNENPLKKEVLNLVSNGKILSIRYASGGNMQLKLFRKNSEDISIVSGGTLNLIGNTNFGSRFNFGPTYNGIESLWTKDENGVETTGDMLRVVAVNNSSTDFKYDEYEDAIKPGERKVIAECSILDIIRMVQHQKKYAPKWFNKVDTYTPATIRDKGIPFNYDEEALANAEYYPSSRQYVMK